MLQHFFDKNIMFEHVSPWFERKKTVTDKPWQNMLHDKTILS